MSEKPVIKTDDLSKQYRLGLTLKPVDAVTDLNLEVMEGEIFAFIGLNGAGKTTTIKLLLDHARPTKGKASLFGLDATDPTSRERIGYLPDLPHFYQFLTANELLDYSGKLFGLSKIERLKRAGELLETVGLRDRANERLRGFSRGMLQRLGFAQALINNPDLVILDEPLGGLDPVGRVDLMNLITGLKGKNTTVFFSSHILEDAQRVADRIGIIHKGRLLACGEKSELLKEKTGWEVEIGINDFDLSSLFNEHNWHFQKHRDRYSVTIPDDEGMQKLYALAADNRIIIQTLRHRQLNLEEAFLKELDRWEA
ncbi:MAG: ABC transporter ATP-binding protein [Calditrichaeota bacterium]|nr:ABC transporter ATP-binding protein [Calditrichota bacterium]